jgi:hypothetical protein
MSHRGASAGEGRHENGVTAKFKCITRGLCEADGKSRATLLRVVHGGRERRERSLGSGGERRPSGVTLQGQCFGISPGSKLVLS